MIVDFVTDDETWASIEVDDELWARIEESAAERNMPVDLYMVALLEWQIIPVEISNFIHDVWPLEGTAEWSATSLENWGGV